MSPSAIHDVDKTALLVTQFGVAASLVLSTTWLRPTAFLYIIDGAFCLTKSILHVLLLVDLSLSVALGEANQWVLVATCRSVQRSLRLSPHLHLGRGHELRTGRRLSHWWNCLSVRSLWMLLIWGQAWTYPCSWLSPHCLIYVKTVFSVIEVVIGQETCIGRTALGLPPTDSGTGRSAQSGVNSARVLVRWGPADRWSHLV